MGFRWHWASLALLGVRLWVAAMGCRRIAVVVEKGDVHGAPGRGLSVYGSSRIWLHKAIAKVVVFVRRKEGRGLWRLWVSCWEMVL